MSNPQELVKEFHETYGLPVKQDEQEIVGSRLALRLELIREEYAELIDAVHQNDIVETADALGDLVYVIYGMAIEFGIPLDKVLEEIQDSNMSKLPPCESCEGAGYLNPVINEEEFFVSFDTCEACNGSGDGPPIYREDGKVMKGPSFFKPDIKGVLGI